MPIPEIIIAASVILSGVLLVIRRNQKPGINYSLIIAGLAALAGIFHGSGVYLSDCSVPAIICVRREGRAQTRTNEGTMTTNEGTMSTNESTGRH